MGALAHPCGKGAQAQVNRLCAELAQEIALGFGIGGGARFRRGSIFARRIFTPQQANSYVSGLDPGAAGEKKIAKGDGVGDAEGRLAIFVVVLNAVCQDGESLPNGFRREAGRFGARDGFACGRGHPLRNAARGRLTASKLDVALRLQECQGSLRVAVINF